MSELRRGARPLAAALVGVGTGASPIPFYLLPLLLGPIHAETGWSFGAISGGITIFGLMSGLLGPVYGAMADRLGVRRVALASLAAFGVLFAAFRFVPSSLLGYDLFWGVLALVGVGSTPLTWSRAVTLWFVRRRGFALGVMLLGTSLAGFVTPLIAQRTIQAWGWRMSFPVLALLPLLIGLPITYAWFREPRPQERPAGVADPSGRILGVTARQVVANPRFWVLQASILLVSLAYGGAHIHLAQIVILNGFSAAQAARVISVLALGVMLGRVGVGLLFDRFWAPGVAFPVLLLPAVACWLLSGVGVTLPALTLGGFLLGIATGTESDVIAYLASRYFGLAHYGRIYGLLYIPFCIGSALSPVLYGAVRDATGGYGAMLYAAMAMFVAGGGLLLTLGPYPGQGGGETPVGPSAVRANGTSVGIAAVAAATTARSSLEPMP